VKNVSKNITICCDKIIVGLLLVAVILVPLFFDIRLYSVFDLSKATALYLITIAILVIWALLLGFKYDFKFTHTKLDIPILAFLFVFILSTITSINPIISLFGTYKRFEGLIATACYIFIFYATINFINTKRRVLLVILSLLGGVFISSSYGIIQHFGFDCFHWSSSGPRVFSTFGNPAFFSAYLVMSLPLAVVLFFRRQPLSKTYNYSTVVWIFLTLSCIIYTAFWLTNTRACFVALIGGIVPLIFVIFKGGLTEKYKIIALIIPFVLIGIFFNVRHETSVLKHFADDIETPDRSDDVSVGGKVLDTAPNPPEQPTHSRPWIAKKFYVGGSSFSRIFQYLSAIMIIKDYPALGIGPDTIGIVFQRNLAKVFSVLEKDNGFRFPRQDRIHNDILDTAVTRGIYGLGTYIWLLAAFGMYMGKNYRRLGSQDKLLLFGLLAGIICYLIQNEFSFGNTPIVVLFWIMMGLCVSIIKMRENETTEPSVLKTKEVPAKKWLIGRWAVSGIVLAMLGFVTVFVVRAYQADAYFEYGRRILTYEKENAKSISNRGIFFVKHAILLNPYEIFYRDELCRTYIQKASKTKNEKWVQKAHIETLKSLKLIPQHYLGFFHMGMISQLLAEEFGRNTMGHAIASYKKAIAADPFQAPFHSNLASIYLNRGDLDNAIRELYKAYLIRPNELKHVNRLANAYLQKGDMENALYFAKKCTELNPSEPAFYNNVAAIFMKKGMHEKAIQAFKKATELNPNDPVYLDNLTKLYMSLEKYEELIPYYKKLIELKPSVADYHNNLGVVYKRKNQQEKAIPFFQKAVELKPDNPVYVHNLASTFVDVGQSAEAKNITRKFNQTHPDHNHINLHILLADLYSKNTDWNKVVSECKQALEIDKNSITAHKLLGLAYYNLNQYQLAEKSFNRVLELDSKDQKSRDMLAKIALKTQE